MSISFLAERFYYTWGPHDPALSVPSGATVCVACPDADNGQADGAPLPANRRQTSDRFATFEGNPLAGPIHVHGLTASDALAIDLRDIALDRSYGLTLQAPAHGALSRDEILGSQAASTDEGVARHLFRWRLDQQRGLAELDPPFGSEPLCVPLRPMLGCVGVAPQWGQSLASLFAGPHGGNLDLPLLKRGATLLLPVFYAGGGLLLGDVHAAQGAGEIVGGGIETSGVVTLTLRRVAGRPLGAPRVLVDDALYAVATGGDLRSAVTTAYSRLLEWLVNEFSLQRWDALQIVSQAGRIEIGGMSVPSNFSVAAGIAVDLLPPRCRQELDRWR